MKKLIAVSLIALMSIIIVYSYFPSTGGVAAASSDLSSVNSEQALSRAKQLSDVIASPEMKFRMIKKRKDFPPFTNCYLFEVSLNVDSSAETTTTNDPNVPGGKKKVVKPGTPMNAFIWVEAETGRIIRYQPHSNYTFLKNAKKPLLTESELLSKSEALTIAQGIAQITNIDMSSMKLTYEGKIKFADHFNYQAYIYTWAKFLDVQDVGSMETPESLMIQLDAETGELTDLLYKKYDVRVDAHSPSITKDRAVEIAAKACQPEGSYKTTANLMVYPGQYPDYGKNEFTWAVRFQENGNRYRMAIINADTGEVIDATLH